MIILGKALNSLNQNQASSTFNFFSNKNSSQPATTTTADLTAAKSSQLTIGSPKKVLNRYGDSPNAVYTGGTPAF